MSTQQTQSTIDDSSEVVIKLAYPDQNRELKISALRSIASFFEDNPDLPMPYIYVNHSISLWDFEGDEDSRKAQVKAVLRQVRKGSHQNLWQGQEVDR